MVTLTTFDWIKAGFRALESEGHSAIKAERLARQLKVSKGSFYWHFNTIADLKTEMLKFWQQAATKNIIAQVETNARSAKVQLKQLVIHSSEQNNPEFGGRYLEPAIRDWARYDANVAQFVYAIDKSRLDFVRILFSETGQDNATAKQSSHILYGALIGLEILSYEGFSNPTADLDALLERLLPN